MKAIIVPVSILLLFFISVRAQVPKATLIKIVKAEDSRQYDASLEELMASPNEQIRIRAALAAGRIGEDDAIPVLARILESKGSTALRAMAAFAIGEIESVKGAQAILTVLGDSSTPAGVRSRAVEAAGKIAAANQPRPDTEKPPEVQQLGEAVLDVLESELAKGQKQHRETVLLALTATLRARPDDTGLVVARFLTNLDARVRADAANTLSRVRAKNAGDALRTMLLADPDSIARASAARALGAAEDKQAFDLLLTAATEDRDSRVRVSAIRAVGSLRDAKAIDKLLDQGETLIAAARKSKQARPSELGELLEIAAVAGRLVAGTNDGRTVKFLEEARVIDRSRSPEIETAFARVAPEKYVGLAFAAFRTSLDPWTISAVSGALQTYAASKDEALKGRALFGLTEFLFARSKDGFGEKLKRKPNLLMSMPDLIRAYAAFKPADLNKVLLDALDSEDVFVRASAADLLADLPPSKANTDALRSAFKNAMRNDRLYNDAQLSMVGALFRLDKTAAFEAIREALNSDDQLVRRSAADRLRDRNAWSEIPAIEFSRVVAAAESDGGHVRQYDPNGKTKLGQVLDTDADYQRALARKNGKVRAVLTTTKGVFSIDLLPEDAPLTVDNFIKLARSNYFNGVAVHRVVPNFVMQDGDPRGDGNGGPGWSIRCEINIVPFERGAVGMALSGKDTGGSQWFIDHSPQPHLDGGYTVFGKVNETGMKIVDKIVRGDKILSVRIIESGSSQRPQRARR